MNIDENFHQRWEFRRKEVDGDTSSDDDSQSKENKRLDIVTDLVLIENDEARDKQIVEADEKKIKSSKKKKKNGVWNISNGCSVKKISKNKNPKNEEIVMLKDLKVFADSLIQEFTVSRENMFAHMKEEMRKMVACRSKPIKKNVRCSQKNKSIRQKGIGSSDRNVKSNVGSDACRFPKNDQVLEVTTKNDRLPKGDDGLRISKTAHMNLAKGSNQVVSSSYLTRPTIIPKPLSQNQRNNLPLNDHIHTPPGVRMVNSNRDIGKLRDDKRFYHQFAGSRHEEQSVSFFHRSVGLLGQNCPQMASVAFPVPLISHGTDDGSNISSMTFCENSFVDDKKLGPGMNSVVRFPRGNTALSDQILSYNVNNNVTRKSDQFASVRPQELRDG